MRIASYYNTSPSHISSYHTGHKRLTTKKKRITKPSLIIQPSFYAELKQRQEQLLQQRLLQQREHLRQKYICSGFQSYWNDCPQNFPDFVLKLEEIMMSLGGRITLHLNGVKEIKYQNSGKSFSLCYDSSNLLNFQLQVSKNVVRGKNSTKFMLDGIEFVVEIKSHRNAPRKTQSGREFGEDYQVTKAFFVCLRELLR